MSPADYQGAVPDPYWFWMEFGASGEVKRALWLTQALRVRLAEAQNWRCCYCGDAVVCHGKRSAANYATFEHVQRRCDGGDDDPDNLVIACGPCNGRRDARDPYTYGGWRSTAPTPSVWLNPESLRREAA